MRQQQQQRRRRPRPRRLAAAQQPSIQSPQLPLSRQKVKKGFAMPFCRPDQRTLSRRSFFGGSGSGNLEISLIKIHSTKQDDENIYLKLISIVQNLAQKHSACPPKAGELVTGCCCCCVLVSLLVSRLASWRKLTSSSLQL